MNPSFAKNSDGKAKDDEEFSQNKFKRRTKMSWAQRLKRVFDIEITTCKHCGGTVKVIACIEDRETIDKILTHVRKKEAEDIGNGSEARAPPLAGLLGNQ